jgi:hypothetical protein
MVCCWAQAAGLKGRRPFEAQGKPALQELGGIVKCWACFSMREVYQKGKYDVKNIFGHFASCGGSDG